MGRIKCRVVTCVPPWEISDCTRASATDDGTANQNASCLSSGPTYPPPPCDSPSTNCEVVGIEVSQTGKGYGLVTSYGKILGYGNSESGSVQRERSTPVSALVACPLGGRWAVTQPGRVLPMLGAPYYGDALKLNLASAIVDMAATPTGKGYWLVSARGRVQAYGDAAFYGDDRSLATETPFVAIVPTATGKGYWLPTAGGRISAFGDAKYSGSPLTLHLEDPIVGMASDGAGGYWAVSSGGRVLPYGGAGRYGDPVNKPLPYPIVAMAATHIGKGYYLVASDGEIFNYGDAVYYGDPIKKKG